jgi:Protein of unknown function (DUF3999)
MKRIPAILALLACATLPLHATTPDDFRAQRGVLDTPIAVPQLVEVLLDASVMAHTQNDFSDLRLFNGADQELPRVIEPLYSQQERTVHHSLASRSITLRELPGNRIEARFSLLKDESFPDGITIRTPLKDFIRTIRISGSEDGESWTPLVEDAEIFDYSRYMDIRRTELPLPENSYRHFSIEISNASEERAQPLIHLVQAHGQDQSRAFDLLHTPFRIDGVRFWRNTTHVSKDKPVLQEWPPLRSDVTQQKDDKTTEILLETARAPLTRVEIETSAHNFQRNASVQVPTFANGKKIWRTVGKGTFTRVDLPGFSTNDMHIDFPQQRVDELRIVIENADNPSLEISGVRTYGSTLLLLWLAEPGTPYRLAYANDTLPVPAYDLFAIRAALDTRIEPVRWDLAEAPPLSSQKGAFGIGAFFARPAVFGSVLGLAALALLILLAKALKKAA